MASIQEYLDLIKNAIYGKDVRQAIHDGIQQCYYDGKAGSTDLEARQRLDSAEGSIISLGSRMSTAENDIDVLDSRVDQIVAPSGEAPSAAEVSDARIGVDGTTYNNLGDAVRGQASNLGVDLGISKRRSADLSGTTGATYGEFYRDFSTISGEEGKKYRISLEVTGVTIKDVTVYGTISAGQFSDPLLTFTDPSRSYEFVSDDDYIGFRVFVNANEKGAAYTAKITIIEINSYGALSDISTINENLVSMSADMIELASNDVEEYSHTGSQYGWNQRYTALVVANPIQNVLKVLSVSFNVQVASQVFFGLMTISESTGTIEAVKILNFEAGINKAIVNFELDPTKTYYPFLRIASGVINFSGNATEDKYYTFSVTGAVSEGETYTLTTASGNGLNILSCELLVNEKSNSKGNTVTVAKSGGDYSTISEAVVYAKTKASAENPITILIYPGIYDEVVRVGAQQYISLIGINRDDCIIRDTSGKYANSPLLISGDFTVANLTIIANHDNAGTFVPTWVVGDFSTMASYAVHCDNIGGSAEAPALGRFENCRLYSECNNAAGLGIHPYQTIEFDNCVIERHVTDINYWDDLYYTGALACHSAVTEPLADEHEEHLVLKNCVIISNGEKTIQLYHYRAGSPMDVTAIGCSLQDKNGISNVVRFYRGEEANYIGQLSHANSTDELNYSVS